MARAPTGLDCAAIRRASTVYLHCGVGVVGRAWRRGVVHLAIAGSHTRSAAGPLVTNTAAPLGTSCGLARSDPAQVPTLGVAESRVADENRLHRKTRIPGSAGPKAAFGTP